MPSHVYQSKFSASAKYKAAGGQDKDEKSQDVQSRDRMLFEATGGNTILAAEYEISYFTFYVVTAADVRMCPSPPKWCSSVLHHNNWRVIERTEMKPLADAIAGCSSKGLEKVREWFVNAVPIRSQFIEIPPSRTMMVRMKVKSRIPCIDDSSRAVRSYFGYNKKPVHFHRMGLKKKRIVISSEIAGYADNGVMADITTTVDQVSSYQKLLAYFSYFLLMKSC